MTLTSEMVQAIRGAVKAGDYASSSEIVREALRDWRHNQMLRKRQLAEVRGEIHAGIEDLEAGRVREFDAERIVKKGRKRLAAGEPSA